MDPQSLIEQYRNKGILVDTNLLLLLAIGNYRRARIESFKRTLQYTLDDFDFVEGIISSFQRRITTPNILTEADNLLRQLPQSEHQAAAAVMAQLVRDMFEQYWASSEIVQHQRFARLGLTDCTTIASAENVLVITDDFQLSNVLSRLGCDAININHIRTTRWR